MPDYDPNYVSVSGTSEFKGLFRSSGEFRSGQKKGLQYQTGTKRKTPRPAGQHAGLSHGLELCGTTDWHRMEHQYQIGLDVHS